MQKILEGAVGKSRLLFRTLYSSYGDGSEAGLAEDRMDDDPSLPGFAVLRPFRTFRPSSRGTAEELSFERQDCRKHSL